MRFSAGTRFGPYEVLSPIGAGGMGEVYRARDMKLDREVALKILPQAFASDPERVARFEREARTLASLNHPHIAQIYGLEEGLVESGFHGRALVMELIEGEDLTPAIARGPMAIDEAAAIARQIAAALEAAHEQGIIHRDLKPANIKQRPDGTVKVLDFGLAKALDPLPATSAAGAPSSPTITAQLTAQGTVLGTAGYMSPEQVRGKPVDKRADIWAFGVVFLEMLTGRPLFTGESISDVLVSVLTQKVPWDALPLTTPQQVRWLLRRCLEREPRDRLRDVGEARVMLEQRSEDLRQESDSTRSSSQHRSTSSRPRSGFRLRFDVSLSRGIGLTRPSVNPVLAVSPDGNQIAFTAARSLWIWSAETGEVHSLDDTAGARAPFFSPDGREVGFFTANELRRIPVNGGPATAIGLVSGGGGGGWARDGTVLYHRWIGSERGLWRVSVRTGESQLLAGAPTWTDLRAFPSLLPDGQHYVYLAGHLHVGERWICVASIDGGEPHRLTRGDSNPAYSATGHILFVRLGRLMALPFDASTRCPTGEPVLVHSRVRWFGPTGVASFAVSANGRTLVHHPPAGLSRLAWIERRTRAIESLGEPARYGSVLLSPDGKTVATEIWNDQKEGRDLYTVDLASGVPTRLTQEVVDVIMGGWSPDQQLVFSRAVSSPPDIFSMRLDAPGEPRLLLSGPGVQIARHCSPDGRYVAYVEQNAEGQERLQIRLLSLDGSSRRFRDMAGDSVDPRFSPDGRWLAYVSVDADGPEIYVAPVEGPGAARRLSRSGGMLPRWRGDGGELYFVQPDGMMVGVDPAGTLPVPSLLFPLEGIDPTAADHRDSERFFDYDVTADGQRFLVRLPVQTELVNSLRVAVGWAPRR